MPPTEKPVVLIVRFFVEIVAMSSVTLLAMMGRGTEAALFFTIMLAALWYFRLGGMSETA